MIKWYDSDDAYREDPDPETETDTGGGGENRVPAVVVAGSQQLERPETTPGCWHPTVEQMVRTRDDRAWAEATGHLALNRKYVLRGFGKTPALCSDHRVRPGDIVDIRYLTTGGCVRIETAGGHAVVVPEFQSVLTPRGSRLPTRLIPGDEVYVRGGFEGRLAGDGQRRLTRGERRGGGYEGHGFPEGEANPGFVDGGERRFRKIREQLIAEIGVCEICGGAHHRLELHHRDRDRRNNERCNLQLLCPGCHKTQEYVLGRTRRGERGHPLVIDTVTEVTAVGSMDVFMVLLAGDVSGASVGRLVLPGGTAEID